MPSIFSGDDDSPGGIGTFGSFPEVKVPSGQDNGGTGLPDSRSNRPSPFFQGGPAKPKVTPTVKPPARDDAPPSTPKPPIEPTTQIDTPATFPTTAELAATFFSGLSEASPFAGAAREGFDPGSQVPTNIAEAQLSQSWLLDSTQSGERITLDETGRWVRAEGGPADAEDIALAEFRDQVHAQIADLRVRSMEFESEVADNQLQKDLQAAEEQLAQARQLALEREAQITAQKTAVAQGAEARKTAALEHAQRLAEIEADHDNRLAELQEQGLEERFTLELKQRLDIGVLERSAELDAELQTARLNFEGAQRTLDRSLQALELEEAQRASQAMEALQAQQLQLQNQQFKLSVFQSIANSPEMLFFLGKSGSLQSFGDLLGDGGAAIQTMVDRINERPTKNIQEFARLTAGEQGIERFRLSAQTGETDVEGALRGAAPAPVINPTAFSTPIRPGRPGASDRSRLQLT